MDSRTYFKEVLRRFSEEYGEQEAFRLWDGTDMRQVTFGRFAEDILQVSGYFRELRPGKKHIALAAGNSYEWLVVFFSVLSGGDVAVLINPDLPEEELRRQCEFADVSFVFRAKTEAGLEERVLGVPVLSWEEVYRSGAAPLAEIEERDEKEPAWLLFTSGTLGTSKAIMLTIENLEIFREDVWEQFQIGSLMVINPMYHIGGLGGVLYNLMHGRPVCIGRGIKYLFQDLPVLNPDHMVMVPGIMDTFVKILKKYPDPADRKRLIGDRLKYLGTGGAASNEDVLCYLMEQGFELSTGYGLTESTGYGMSIILSKDSLNSIGVPDPGLRCRIQDGELLLAGKCIMAGYYKDPEATRRAVGDGWLRTGDLVRCDEKGRYYVTGRKKNLIILSNGENVSPEELEAELRRCGAVLECRVYGDRKGICAEVYADDRECAEAWIGEYNKSVPTYRKIYKINYVNSPLEKTGSGKIKRRGSGS